MTSTPFPPSPRVPPGRWWWRLAAVMVLAAGLYAIGRETGLSDGLSPSALRLRIGGTGLWGMAVFVAAFTVGLFLHVPGLLFVGAGIAVYGRLLGGVLSFGAAVIAVTASFLAVRTIGGQALAAMGTPLMRRLLDRLDAHPILTAAALRLIFLMSPPLNYALGLSTIRFRDYLAGSALGLVLPIAAASLLFDWLFR